MLKYMFSFIVLVYAVNSNAGGSTGYSEIQEMYTNNNWTMVIVPGIRDHNTIDGNPDKCESKSYYAIMPEDKNYEALHSVLMAAQMSGKSVRFYVGGCSGQNGMFPHIVSIWLK